MGFSISWVAVQSDHRDSIFEMLAVAPTDEEDEYFESRFSGAALNNGWLLLVGQGCENRLVHEPVLRELSAFGSVIACSIEEHVMYSAAAMWEAGCKKWSVVHDAQQGMLHLEATGSLPKSFEGLCSKKRAEQDAEGGEKADVDLIFEIPLLLAAEFTGFKHDEDCDALAQKNPVVFLDQRAARTRPWWKFW